MVWVELRKSQEDNIKSLQMNERGLAQGVRPTDNGSPGGTRSPDLSGSFS